MRRAVPLALAVLIAVVGTPAFAASDVSAARFRSLARDAIDDPEALAELREVTSVDGEPIDIAPALQGAEGAELDRRLEVIANSEPVTAQDSDSARDRADDILGGSAYREPDVPRPFEGVLETLGDWLSPLQGLLDWLRDLWPGAGSPTWWILAGVVFLAAIAIATLVIARRSRRSVTHAAVHHGVSRGDDPNELERRAAEAEGNGDLETAIRLRFLAGLLRLDRARVIEFHPWLTSGQVARTLRSDSFDDIAATFDRVVYGRLRPEPNDAADSRTGWARVLEEARSA